MGWIALSGPSLRLSTGYYGHYLRANLVNLPLETTELVITSHSSNRRCTIRLSLNEGFGAWASDPLSHWDVSAHLHEGMM
jgi:hypothetical protein